MSRILVIEDDVATADSIAQMLRQAGFEVACAANGAEGIAQQRRLPADVVITDLLMPEKDGIEVIIELQRLTPGLGIIAISGGMHGSELNLLPAAKQLGARYTLPKPFRKETLLSLVSAASRPTVSR